MSTPKLERAPTIEELLDVSWCVQMHAAEDLAFIFDATGDVMVAIVEINSGRRLPFLTGSPAERFVRSGDHLILESFHGPRSLGCWLNRCRDYGAVLAWTKSQELRCWWLDGCNRLDVHQVRSWLEV